MGQSRPGSTEIAGWQAAGAIRDRFVGREQELADLWERLNSALSGRGQVTLVKGQAGSGKTALVFHFLQRAFALESDFAVATGGCNAQTGIGDPYLPFREALLTLTGGDSERRVAGLPNVTGPGTGRKALVRSAQVLIEVAPDLIGLFVPGASLAGTLGKAVAEKMGWVDKLEDLAKPVAAPDQTRVFEQYTSYIQRLSEQVPVLLFVDDLQWADSGSLGLFFHLARRIGDDRVILVGAYRGTDVALGRAGQRHPLEPIVRELTRYYGDITIDLDRIPDVVSRHFVDALLDAEPNRLTATFRQALYNHTQGHALFTVELLDMMRRRGSLVQEDGGIWVEGAGIDWRALPPRVEGIIGERIDRLDDQLRETLTIASVEGESFTAEVVARIRALEERETVRQLSRDLAEEHRLVGPQGTVQIGRRRLSLYRFLHSLFQQYLYENLSEAERIYLHEDVGRVLELLYEDHTEEVATQLARHYELAGRWQKATSYHLQAANRALRLSGHPEAVQHTEQGLALLQKVSAGPERDALNLGLQVALAVASISSNGYNCAQARWAFRQARQLAQEIGDADQELAALHGLCLVSLLRGDLSAARDLGEQLVARAGELNSTTYQFGGELVRAAAEMHLGHLESAREGLERLVGRYDPSAHGHLAPQLTWDPGVAAWSFLGLIRWQQGDPGQAVTAIEQALRLARNIGHPFSLGQALSFSSVLQLLLRNTEASLTHAEEALAIGHRGNYYAWEAMGGVTRGLALARQGNTQDGIASIEQSLQLWLEVGARLTADYYQVNLAEAFLLAGDPEAGLRAIDGAKGPPEARWWEPERLRLRAQLVLAGRGYSYATEGLLQEALTLSRELGSTAFELRAAIDLVRLLDRTDRGAEALKALADAYGRHREGFDTPDLVEARQLLADHNTGPDTVTRRS